MQPYTGTRVIYRDPSNSTPMFWDEPVEQQPTREPDSEPRNRWNDEAPRWIGVEITSPDYCYSTFYHREGCPGHREGCSKWISDEPPF